MHENANITFNRAESSTLMSSILALQQPREGGGGGGKSSDEIVIDVIDDAEERMPSLGRGRQGPDDLRDPGQRLVDVVDTVLMQEMVKFNRLMTNMSSSLSSAETSHWRFSDHVF